MFTYCLIDYYVKQFELLNIFDLLTLVVNGLI